MWSVDFTLSLLDEVGGQRQSLAVLPQEKRPGARLAGGWVGPRASLHRVEVSNPTGIRSPDRPGRSDSLCRIRCPGLHVIV